MVAKIGSGPVCNCKKTVSRAWCKTIVTTTFYIRSYNSFAPSPRYVILKHVLHPFADRGFLGYG